MPMSFVMYHSCYPLYSVEAAVLQRTLYVNGQVEDYLWLLVPKWEGPQWLADMGRIC